MLCLYFYSLLPDHFIGMIIFCIFAILLIPISVASATCQPNVLGNMSPIEQAMFVSTHLPNASYTDISIGVRLLTTSIELEYLADPLLRNAIVNAMDSLNTDTFIPQINASLSNSFSALLHSFNSQFVSRSLEPAPLGSTLSTNTNSISVLGYKVTWWRFSGLHLVYTKSVNQSIAITEGYYPQSQSAYAATLSISPHVISNTGDTYTLSIQYINSGNFALAQQSQLYHIININLNGQSVTSAAPLYYSLCTPVQNTAVVTRCVRQEAGQWLQTGCWKTAANRLNKNASCIISYCACSHLSSLSVQVSQLVYMPDYIVLVPTCLSFVSVATLLLLIFCILSRENTRSSLFMQVYLSQAFCLMLTSVVFILALFSSWYGYQTDGFTLLQVCRAMEQLLYYTCMSSITWMLVSTVHLYIMLTRFIPSTEWLFFKYSLAAWSIPLVLEIPLFIADRVLAAKDRIFAMNDPLTDGYFRFLQKEAFLGGWLGPGITIYVIIGIILLVSLIKHHKHEQEDDLIHRSLINIALRLIVGNLVIISTPWCLRLAHVFTSLPVLLFLFFVFLALQGILFVSFSVLNHPVLLKVITSSFSSVCKNIRLRFKSSNLSSSSKSRATRSTGLQSNESLNIVANTAGAQELYKWKSRPSDRIKIQKKRELTTRIY